MVDLLRQQIPPSKDFRITIAIRMGDTHPL